MANKKRITQAEPHIEPGVPEGHLTTLENQNELARFESAMQHGLQAGMAIGRIQAMGFIQQAATVALITQFEKVKKTKEYKGLEYVDAAGNLQRLQTLEEYCEVFLGKSYRTMALESQNYRFLGEDLYERAEKLGLGARDYQAIRALPEDDRLAAMQLIESAESKDQLIDAIEEMAVRSAKLRTENADLKAENEAKEKVLADERALITKLQTKQARIKPPTPDEDGAELRKEAGDYALQAEGLIRGSIRDGFLQLREHAEEHGGNHDEFMAGILAQLDRCIAEVRSELDIKQVADGDPIPKWARGGTGVKLAAVASE